MKAQNHFDPNMNVDRKSTIVESACGPRTKGRIDVTMKQVMLPQILKNLMNKRGLTARVLAKELQLPLSTLGSYLSGKKASYSPDHLRRIAEYFDVSIDYLLFEKGSDSANLNLLTTEDVFSGWLKVKIERAIPQKKDSD